MSLTLEKLHRLEKKGFDTLYDDHADKWVAMVTNARVYAATFIDGGNVIRPGDVSAIIQNAIKVDPNFEEHVKAKSLQQKYWVEYFAEYILDRIYPTVAD